VEFLIRSIRTPDDYEAVASLINFIASEPVSAKQLLEDELKIPPGQLHYNEDGYLMGWDRPKWVAEDERGEVIAYGIAWRAPWTEPGALSHTVIVHPDVRSRGVGTALYNTMCQWVNEVKASRLIDYIRESDEVSLSYAARRGYEVERHTFESVLDIADFNRHDLFDTISTVEHAGIQLVTLADEPGEESEIKLYELYKETSPDIPGYTGDYPDFHEWKKWNIGQPGTDPAWIHIAKEGDTYIGVATLVQNEQTRAMYHEYTGVRKAYRERHIALALKLISIQTARKVGAPYLRTHNDSMNVPMLRINRDLLGFRAEPGNFKVVREWRQL
jgi:GNAT superfamily N-acetyltransferase